MTDNRGWTRSTWMLPALAILAATAYGLHWHLEIKAVSVALKMTPALLMGLYVVLRRPNTCTAIAFALVMHAMGDGCLDLGKSYFLWGVAAFFVGHFGYIASFWPHRRKWKEIPIALQCLIGVVIALMIGLNLFIWPRMPGVLAVAAPVYAVALTTMCVTALLGKWTGPWVAIGALLFLFSDVLIGLRLFLKMETLAFLIWPTYVIAQIWIPEGWVRTEMAKTLQNQSSGI